uniref:Uncharacterized protein n=1 Tax=Arundo donax TaxID=35708 RepID=A0A0A9CT19_ARUDO
MFPDMKGVVFCLAKYFFSGIFGNSFPVSEQRFVTVMLGSIVGTATGNFCASGRVFPSFVFCTENREPPS